MRTTDRRWAVTLRPALVAAWLVLAAAYAPPGAGDAAAAGLETTRLAIGTAKDPNLGAELVVAREKGFFTAVGLDVEIRYFPSGGDLSAAVVGGSLSIGSSGSTPTTTLRGAPFPIRILAQMSDISGAQQLVAKPAIKRPEDLYGKRVGIMRGTASELLFDSFVKAYGVDRSRIEVVNMGPTEMLTGFVQGQLDGIFVWEPHTTRARKTGNGHILVSGTQSLVPGREGPNRIYGDHAVLFATEDFVRTHPRTTRAVLEALARASEFIERDREGASAILAKEFGLAPDDMRDIVRVNRYTMVLDQTLAADLDRLAEFLGGLGKLKHRLPAREWIDPAPLRDVRPDWVRLN